MGRIDCNIIALLPMKKCSERVPNKNIRDFCGEPLLYKMVRLLNNCELIKKIIINTDSDNIKMLVRDFNKIIIHDRPSNLCGNNIEMNEIIRYDISRYIQSEHFLQSHVTNPLLSEETIYNSIYTYFDNLENYDALFTVSRYQKRLYYPDGSGVNHDPNILINTQDLPVLYEENSCIYIFSRKSFSIYGKRTGSNPLMYEIKNFESFDIDTEDDFLLAEAAYKSKFHTKND